MTLSRVTGGFFFLHSRTNRNEYPAKCVTIARPKSSSQKRRVPVKIFNVITDTFVCVLLLYPVCIYKDLSSTKLPIQCGVAGTQHPQLRDIRHEDNARGLMWQWCNVRRVLLLGLSRGWTTAVCDVMSFKPELYSWRNVHLCQLLLDTHPLTSCACG
jgi:hypothetical protein